MGGCASVESSSHIELRFEPYDHGVLVIATYFLPEPCTSGALSPISHPFFKSIYLIDFFSSQALGVNLETNAQVREVESALFIPCHLPNATSTLYLLHPVRQRNSCHCCRSYGGLACAVPFHH
jgi:hypothetical protein